MFFARLLVVTALATQNALVSAAARYGKCQCLYQSHFNHGTYIISKPGEYKLCSNIQFAPGKPNSTASDEEIALAFDPVVVGGTAYEKNEYALGFFAALVIAAPNVTLHLNGYTIQQDPSHALLQRFFAVIELASAPFIPNAGPAQFVSKDLTSATNFKLNGPGTIGLSSHHGIHGNNNRNVIISNVKFQDFEVAAVSINDVKGLSIVNCQVVRNRHDVPVLGSFSVARQILPYVKALKERKREYSMNLRGKKTTAAQVYTSLIRSIANVYRDVMEQGFVDSVSHPNEFKLFNNPHHVIDGPCYAFLVHGKGPAVGGQGFTMSVNESSISESVDIRNNQIENIRCFTNEVPALVVNNTVQIDARGAVFQLIDTLTNEWIACDKRVHYKGNVITDAQLMVAKAIHNGVLHDSPLLQTNVSSISKDLIKWAEDPESVFKPHFRCNGDIMHHVVKGTIVVRVEDTRGFTIKGNVINSATVLSGPPAATADYFNWFSRNRHSRNQASWTCSSYHNGSSVEDGTEQQLGNLRGISVAAVGSYHLKNNSTDHSCILGNTITGFASKNANCIVGIDMQGVSEGVLVANNDVDLSERVGSNTDDHYISFRVRKFASSGNVVKQNNKFVQDTLYEDIPGRKLRNKKAIPPPNHPHVSFVNEWEYGGCPFGKG